MGINTYGARREMFGGADVATALEEKENRDAAKDYDAAKNYDAAFAMAKFLLTDGMNPVAFPENIVIPNGITTIRANVFSGSQTIKTIEMADSVKYTGAAYGGCANLETIKLSENLDNIPTDCFAGCAKLNNVVLNKHLQGLSQGAFNGCSGLTNLIFPDGMDDFRYIGQKAFNLTKITVLEIPDIKFKDESLVLVFNPGCFSGSTITKVIIHTPRRKVEIGDLTTDVEFVWMNPEDAE